MTTIGLRVTYHKLLSSQDRKALRHYLDLLYPNDQIRLDATRVSRGVMAFSVVIYRRGPSVETSEILPSAGLSPSAVIACVERLVAQADAP